MLKNVGVIVEFAGMIDCNGFYKFKHLKNNAGVFERRDVVNGIPTRYVIHKVIVAPNFPCWFLSILPQHSELTDCLNICWFRSEANSMKDSLPNNNWTHCVAAKQFMPPQVNISFLDLLDFGDKHKNEDEDEDDIIYMVDSSVSGDEEEMKEGEEDDDNQVV
jgi:hypothetical protein